MDTYLLEFSLLGLCMLAAVLWFVQEMQGRAASVGRQRRPEARGLRPTGLHPIPPKRAHAGSAAAGRAVPTAEALFLTDARTPTTEQKLAHAISALYAISRGRDPVSAKIAERTVPRLQDFTEPQEARLSLAVHRLSVISLGRDAQAARLASQCLLSIGSGGD